MPELVVCVLFVNVDIVAVRLSIVTRRSAVAEGPRDVRLI